MVRLDPVLSSSGSLPRVRVVTFVPSLDGQRQPRFPERHNRKGGYSHLFGEKRRYEQGLNLASSGLGSSPLTSRPETPRPETPRPESPGFTDREDSPDDNGTDSLRTVYLDDYLLQSPT